MKFHWRKCICCESGSSPHFYRRMHLRMMKSKEKVVFQISDESVKQKAKEVIQKFPGITSVDDKEYRNLTVIGIFDKFKMMKKLKKIDHQVTITEITTVGEKKKEVNKPPEPKAPIDSKNENKPSDASWYDVVKDYGARVAGQFNRENADKLINIGRNFVGYFQKEDPKKRKP